MLMSTIKGEVHVIKKTLLLSNIQQSQQDIHVEGIHSSEIHCLIELNDKRIVTCGNDKSISIVSLDYETKQWKQNIKKQNAHYNTINSLSELINDKLVSCSADKTIKLWKIATTELNLISTLTNRNQFVYKVIPFSHNRFSSGSEDSTVKIWNNDYPYTLISSLKRDDYVYDLLQMKKKKY